MDRPNPFLGKPPARIGQDAHAQLTGRYTTESDATVALMMIEALAKGLAARVESFQERVKPWMTACFGEAVSNDRLERGDRLLEEVLELLQSGDYPPERVAQLVAYTYGRPKGEPRQEAGGVMVTLAAYCLAHGIDMHEAGEAELTRIWTKVDQIRAKQAAKPHRSPLPIPTGAVERGG